MNPRVGYGSQTVRTDSDTEYDVFSRVTRMLRQADRECASSQSILAVHKNNELWTLMATDLASPGNRLPDELKAGLLALAQFSIRHGHEAMSGRVTTDVLIDINLSIMKGLRGEVAA